MSTQIRIGYNKRCWAIFTVKDATDEEILSLDVNDRDDPAALDLLRHLDAEERLIFEGEEQDDNPTYVQEWDEPALIELWDTSDMEASA